MTAQERTYPYAKLLMISALYDMIDAMDTACILRSNVDQALLFLRVQECGQARDYRVDLWSHSCGTCLRIEAVECHRTGSDQQRALTALFDALDVFLQKSMPQEGENQRSRSQEGENQRSRSQEGENQRSRSQEGENQRSRSQEGENQRSRSQDQDPQGGAHGNGL